MVAGEKDAPATRAPEGHGCRGAKASNPRALPSGGDDSDAPEWAEAQHKAAGDFLRQCAELESARKFLERNHNIVDPVWHEQRGHHRYVLAHQPDFPHPVLLCESSLDDGKRVLLNPNAMGRMLPPEQISISPSGRYIALLSLKPGEVLGTLQVLDSITGTILEESDFTTVAASVAWHPTEQGYFYSLCRRLFEPHDRRDGIYWHTFGTPWADDSCVQDYHDGPGHIAYAVIPPDSNLLILFTRHFTSGMSGVRLCQLEGAPSDAPRVQADTVLFEDLESHNQLIGVVEGILYFQTTAGTENGKVVAIDPEQPERSSWRTVVAEGDTALARPERLGGPPKAALAGRSLLLTYVKHAHDVLQHFTLEGEMVRSVCLPTPSTVDGVFGGEEGFRIYAQSFLRPRVVFDYRAEDGALLEVECIAMPDVDLDDYELRQVFYRSKDGSSVPMYLLHRKGLLQDGSHPTLLYGYGGFGQSITPEYSPEIALWLSLGGVYALANIRGGGEYGERWHAAGSRLNKQTSFDDFYSAAEHLVAAGYTGPERLVARGISNGGLLTAVCVNQRPELFAAVVSEMPLTDLMWFDDSAIGQSIATEYGSPKDGRAIFEVLRSYSPLQNVRTTPHAVPQLVVVADQDLSAPPGQAYRYVATRQEAVSGVATSLGSTSGNGSSLLARAIAYAPVLLRIIHGEGHGDWPSEVSRRAWSEEIAFLWHFASTADAARIYRMYDVRVPMRDGIELSADIWLPSLESPFPAVLLRTPYENNAENFERLGLRAYVEAGYAVVVQSVRGRGRSQGDFGFFFVEGTDGYDSVEWVAEQDWCNGKVAMDGGSYLGTVQWLAARECPPHLVCILPAVPAGDWFNEIPYVGGALQVDFAFSWLGALAGLDFDFDTAGDRNLEKYRPLIEAGDVLGAELPLYREILSHPTLDDWWKQLYLGADDFARIGLPVFAVTGWCDGDQAGAMYYWCGHERYSRNAADSKLVVGPWEHQQCYLGGEEQLGELQCGPDSILPLKQMRLAFLDEHMRGIPCPSQPRVRIFTTGSNRWHGFENYPPAGIEPQSWFLQSDGRANTVDGDGRLSQAGPAGCKDRFVYDPGNPVPYRAGARDHGEIERRDDVLVYTSDVLQAPLTAIGLVELLLHASSDAADTDFTAKLLDVHPDGRAISLTHVGGVLRARYRDGFERSELLSPGRVHVFRIRLSHVGHTFQLGHRIRLEISSSCFPLADPNPNTGRDIATEVEYRVAQQAIFHDADRPSQLILPVFGGVWQ